MTYRTLPKLSQSTQGWIMLASSVQKGEFQLFTMRDVSVIFLLPLIFLFPSPFIISTAGLADVERCGPVSPSPNTG